MYFGSVKFFKHLILSVVFGWIIIATGLAVFFGIKYFVLSNEKASDSEITVDSDSINIPDGTSLEQIYLILSAKGYTPEDILTFISQNEPDKLDSFIKTYKSKNNAALDEEDEPQKEPTAFDQDTSAQYTKLYPELYAEAPKEFITEENVAYLTFDDGPSQRTLEIMDILEKYDIKATFFMSGGNDEESQRIMRVVADKGHTIAVHSLSHNYSEVYESVESWLEDFSNTYNSIYQATGVKPSLYRFPGGSINNYNRFINEQITSECTRRGFVYYDWNVSGEDAATNANWTSIYNNVLKGIQSNSSNRAIILLHDSNDKDATVNTLDDIIHELLDDGYTFKPLDNTVKPITFNN